jgi:endonuclease/exonuclease/phosphatase family metal-dependent hydrolase
MRPLIDRRLPDLPTPDPSVLEAARHAPKTPLEHARFMRDIPALHALEQQAPTRSKSLPTRLTVAAFNAERLKFPAATRALLDGAGVHMALLSEVDVGMARSGNRHHFRDLTAPGGEGYVYGVEFVELDLGDRQEIEAHRGERNERSLHATGIVTGVTLEDAILVPLEEGGSWYPGRDGVQHRIGGRIAAAARASGAPRPLWFVSVHLESKSDEADRAAQMRILLEALDRIAPDAAVVMGGDFNTKALPFGDENREVVLRRPDRWEPLFAHLREAGFSWDTSNVPDPTRRKGPSGHEDLPYRKLDWIVTRGVVCEHPRVVPAEDPDGKPISDHEMVAVDIVL